MLLIVALFASYMLQHKKIQAIHETVLSIFAGMPVSQLDCCNRSTHKDQEWPLVLSSS